MMNRCTTIILTGFLMLVLFSSSVSFSDQSPDAFMGNWKGTRKQGGKEALIVAQVIAWGKGKYQANLLDEFDKRGKLIIKLEGNLKGGKVIFDRKMEGKSKPGKKHPLSALSWSCEISNNKFTGKFTGKKNGTFEMKKTVRLSPTLNAKPPKGAIVLFDGSNLDEWDIIKKKKRVVRKKKKIEVIEPLPGKWKLIEGGAMEIVPKTGSLITKKKFSTHKLHIEFRTPFMPEAKGQKRGNSGVYLQGRYEVQVLDSYGLEGKDNECGGIYKVAAPLVDMCAPPLQWQTYDITFYAPKFDKQGNRIKNAIITVLHNGIKIQDNIELPKKTKASYKKTEEKSGVLYLQDHGNPVQYRNIWVVELNK